MSDLDERTVIDVGGWDGRYAVVRAVKTLGDRAAAVIDANGDGADINLEHFTRVDGQWQLRSSGGGAGDWGRGWHDGMWAEHDRDEHGWSLILTLDDDPGYGPDRIPTPDRQDGRMERPGGRPTGALRRATPEDVDLIAGWHPMEPAGVLAWWEDDEVLPWVLEVDGAVCGYGELWLDPGEDEVELARLIVPEARRGAGLGGLLTRLLTAEAATTGLATSMLRTTPDNETAIGCYLANGFTRLSPEEEAVWNAGQRRDWVWMVLGTV